MPKSNIIAQQRKDELAKAVKDIIEMSGDCMEGKGKNFIFLEQLIEEAGYSIAEEAMGDSYSGIPRSFQYLKRKHDILPDTNKEH